MSRQLETNKSFMNDLQKGFNEIGINESDLFLENTENFFNDLYDDDEENF